MASRYILNRLQYWPKGTKGVLQRYFEKVVKREVGLLFPIVTVSRVADLICLQSERDGRDSMADERVSEKPNNIYLSSTMYRALTE